MRTKLTTLLKYFLGWPLSLLALYFIYQTFSPNLPNVLSSAAGADLVFLLLGLVCFVGYFYLRSYLWYKILQFMGYNLEVKDSLFLWSYSQLKRYIPGNIWGYLGLTVSYTERSVKKSDIASAIVLETQLVVISSIVLSLMALPFLIYEVLELQTFADVLIPVSLIGSALLVLLYIFNPVILKHLSVPFLPFIKKIFPPFSYDRTLFLLFMMTISYLLFGFGYLFVISSVVPIHPQMTFVLVGYFIFSLMVGFFSFITPTGLGVREGAVTLGLLKITTLSMAGFAALFARVVQIVGELLFVGIAYLIFNIKNKRVCAVVDYLTMRPYKVVLGIFIIIYATYFSWISFLRYDQYYTGRYDLGNMAQTVWNTARGNIFEFTNPDSTEIVSRLAFHSDFILILLAPFYYVWESPKMLLLIQAIVVALGAIFVYCIAMKLLKHKALALTFALLYLLNPSVQRATLYDFHAVTLATSFLLGAWYYLMQKRYGLFLIFALLAGITKEQIWAIISLFGLYIVFFHKKKLFGGAIFLLGALTFYYLIWHAIPAAAGGNAHFAVSYYASGKEVSGPTGILKRYLTDQEALRALITDKERLTYLKQLFSPLGYLSLLSPLHLIFAAPDLAINLLSSRPQLYQIYYQYTAAITPFLYISAIYGLSVVRKYIPFLPTALIIIYLLGWGLYTAYTYGPLPGAKGSNLAMITQPQPLKEEMDKVIASIPDSASVAATNNLGSHLAHRRYLFTHPHGWDTADYVLFKFSEDRSPEVLEAHRKQAAKLREDTRYELYYEKDGFLVFRKKK